MSKLFQINFLNKTQNLFVKNKNDYKKIKTKIKIKIFIFIFEITQKNRH